MLMCVASDASGMRSMRERLYRRQRGIAAVRSRKAMPAPRRCQPAARAGIGDLTFGFCVRMPVGRLSR